MHGGFARGGARGIGLHPGTHGTHGARRFARGAFPGSPYFYSDYDSSEPYPIPSDVQSGAENSVESIPPQILIVQPASTGDSPRSPKPRPLLIERQGNRYVRFGGAQETEDRGASARPDYSPSAITNPPLSATQATQKARPEAQPPDLPPAVLVYHDGQREEITGYAIANGVVYARGNDWQNGYWTKHIPLAALDLPATVQANQQRGVKFVLPSAANVVIASF